MSISSADGSGPSAMIDPFSTPFLVKLKLHRLFYFSWSTTVNSIKLLGLLS